MKRFGYVIKTGGDPEIAGALAAGIERGTTSSVSPAGCHLPQRGRLLERGPGPLELEQIEVVEAEIDRQHILAALVRVAVGNHKSAEDYAALVTKARGDYARYSRPAGPARRLGERLLALYALLCYGVAAAYRSQDRVLGGRANA